MRNKDKFKQPLFPRFSFTPLFPHTPINTEGIGNGGYRSVHNSSCLLLLPPHTFPLLQHWSFSWAVPTGSSVGWSSFRKHLVWHTLAGKYLLPFHCGLLHGLQWNLCSSAWSNTSTSSFPFNLCVPCAVSHYLFLLLLYLFVLVFLFPCLNIFPEFSQRHHCPGWGAQLYPAVNPWSWLDLCPAWASPGLSLHRMPLKPPHCRHLPNNKIHICQKILSGYKWP